MSVNSMLEAGTISEVQVTATSLARLAKWLSVRLQTKWLWVRISLLSLPKTLFYGVVIVSLNRHSSIGRKVVQISETGK